MSLEIKSCVLDSWDFLNRRTFFHRIFLVRFIRIFFSETFFLRTFTGYQKLLDYRTGYINWFRVTFIPFLFAILFLLFFFVIFLLIPLFVLYLLLLILSSSFSSFNLPAFYSSSICPGFSISFVSFRSSLSSVVSETVLVGEEFMGGKGVGPFKLSFLKQNIFKYYLKIDQFEDVTLRWFL